MYATQNFKKKKELKAAVMAGQSIGVYVPNSMFNAPQNGRAFVEGPWFPKPHMWYAEVELKDGQIVKVK